MTQPTHFVNSTDAPAEYGEAVTPSDSPVDNFDTPWRALYVGGAGAVAIVQIDDSVVVFPAVPAGSTLRFRGRRVNATGTGASNMVAMW
jgi:hypothetical protein